MSSEIRWPRASVILILLLALSVGFLVFPTPIDSLSWYPLHLLMAAALLASSIWVSSEKGRFRDSPQSLPVQSALLVVAGGCVKLLIAMVPLIPLVFFVGYPFSRFALSMRLLWLPAALLAGVAGGRSLFLGDFSLVPWALVFGLYSLPLGRAVARRAVRFDYLKKTHDRLIQDARDMGRRIREQEGDPLKFLSEREKMEASAALGEDALLQGFMSLGCYFMNAMSGILLIPEGPDEFRIRAATVSRSYSEYVSNEPISGGKGIIRLALEREGQLILNDVRPGSVPIPFYAERVPVRSLLIKIIPASDSTEGSGVRYILYFDSTAQDAFPGGDYFENRLRIFCDLLTRVMETESILQRVAWDAHSKSAISEFAKSLTRTLDPDEIARNAVEAIRRGVPRCEGAAFLLNDGGIKVTAVDGGLLEGLEEKQIRRSEPSLMGLLIRNENEIVLDRERSKPSPFFFQKEKLGKVSSFSGIPSVIDKEGEKRLMAVLVGVSSEGGVFGADSINGLRILADITAQALDNAMTHRKVAEMSRTDGLTGLLNHKTFQEVLLKRIERVGRDYEKSLAVVMVDVDYFKKVNDQYGHPVGDEVLRELAAVLRKGVRELDAVARYGGEEFAIILDNVDTKTTRKIVEKIRLSVQEHEFTTSAGSLRQSVSMGYAILTQEDTISKQDLLEMADRALYAAKKQGRNRSVDYQNTEKTRTGTAGPA